MNPWDRVVKIFGFLFMADTSDRQTMRKWQAVVAFVMVLFVGHILWAAGLLNGIGLNGFATENELHRDMRLLTDQIGSEASETKSIQVTLLDQSIMQTRSQQCLANKNSCFAGVLSGLEDQYYSLTGHEYPLPDCADLN